MNTYIVHEKDQREEAILTTTRAIMSAARTAPKAKGVDHLTIVSVNKEGRNAIASKMREMVEENKADSFFLRDAMNLDIADGLVLIGTTIVPMRLNHCGLCGFENCAQKEALSPSTPCSFNTGDLGIAIGSAVSIAADFRVDNRVMFSVGMAARELGLVSEDVKIIQAIVLSIKGKNIFFDRKSN